MSSLEIRGLAYDYVTKAGAVHALKHATASFEMGTVYAIVGRSGSGKSTFMSLLAGLDVPKSGQILYNGTDLAGLDRDRYRREHVGMVFQSYNLFHNKTVLENVMEAQIIVKKRCGACLGAFRKKRGQTGASGGDACACGLGKGPV